MRRNVLLVAPLVFLCLFACNTLKYVPQEKALLKKVSIKTEGKGVNGTDLELYLYQQPNKRFLWIFSLDLAWYNLSGSDTTRWVNRMLRKIGSEPVLYDSVQVERSRSTMQNVLMGKGYFEACVATKVKIKNQKAKVTYMVKPNQPYTIRKYQFIPIADSISQKIAKSMRSSVVRPGMLLSSEKLEEERARLTKVLLKQGYYAMQKDYFSYEVDSSLNTHQADVNLIIRPNLPDTIGMNLTKEAMAKFTHPLYRIKDVYFMLDVPMSSYTRNPLAGITPTSKNQAFDVSGFDTLSTGAYHTVYREKPFVLPEALMENCRIQPGLLYDVNRVEKTYSRMSALQLIKYVNIRFVEQEADSAGFRLLDCYVVLTRSLKQEVGFEVEGTNTAGDLGVAGNVNYTHRNLFHGAELFQAKIRGAYEALSASFKSDYTEIGGEVSTTFPEFKMPFLNADFNKRVDATTALDLSFQKMARPEFERTIASTGVRYNWLKNDLRQTLDLVDLSYVYMPWTSSGFKTYLDSTSYLKYSYQDHFILRTAYSFSYSSMPFGSTARSYYTIRGNIESAGNSLYALYALAGIPKEGGNYTIGHIRFAQYLKGELEYSRSVVLDPRSRIAYRVGMGLAYPYGNSTVLPFEKRFFSGGANSVRGWSVRTLGPGNYHSTSSSIDFMKQSGDMKLDMGAEYRSFLFWKLEGALFADAGNIWTLRNYKEQPGGEFRLGSFYKQIAVSVGGGVRFNFDYFMLRLDLGMKVIDPSLTGDAYWRIRHIDNRDDFALHLAIGYPF